MEIVVFWEDGFPAVDSPPQDREALQKGIDSRHTVRFCGSTELADALASRPDLLVTPYGSAFPKPAWSAFMAYLRGGGNWVNLGGAPLTRPVRREGRRWYVEVGQTALGKKLRINYAFEIRLPGEYAVRCPALDVDLETCFQRYRPERAWSLQVRFTDTRDFPEEGGSGGPREAVMHPLVYAEAHGRRVAAPVVAIDRLTGEFAGGRWVFAACAADQPLPTRLIGALCEYATRSRAELTVSPSFACYYPGEQPTLTVRVTPSRAADLKINLRVYARESQKEVYAHTFRSHADKGPTFVQTSPFPAGDPGLYVVRANVEMEAHNKPVATAETGFWVFDRDLLTSGKPLTTRKDYFYRDGKPYPVTGTTYMAGDAHRKFLFEPNPAVWDADFTAMVEAGVNMVRTGLWTGWKRVMLDPGAVDEGVLRAFTAFLLTARRYDIPVIFTFFAFLPEAWGGVNPYLDPTAVVAQKALVAAFARRFAGVNDLLWDFINEPSFSSPARVWSTRPNYDAYEHAAWVEWLAKQGVSDDEWRERWRLAPDDPLDLPALEDFEDRYIFQGTHPIRAMDYRRFAQENFAVWAAQMAAVVRENGNPAQLVTVGQDEGGTGERPSPWFYGPAVDFTSNHSWWQNDDLLWDSVITKTPDRPNLIEETGIMFVEGVDGRAWRTPEECRNLLERKMALAFAAGCAGFIQWLWNTNVYMDSDNEVGIGFLRADGTEKPELEAFRGIARFFAANAHRMAGRKPEEVVIIIPYSNLFSVRNTADVATRRAVRTLEYDLGIPCRAVSEYRAEEVGDARLIVLPSARVLIDSCWQTLLRKVEAGATLMATGYIDSDEYWRPVERLGRFGIEVAAEPVAPALYRGDSIQKLDGARILGQERQDIRVIEHGLGRILFEPAPLELSHVAQPHYSSALAMCGLRTEEKRTHAKGLLVRRVEFAGCTLLLLVNETGDDLSSPEDVPFGLRVPSGRIALAFVDYANKQVLAKYEVPDSVKPARI